MATYKSLESLKAAILKEVRSAVDAAAQESKNVLQKNVDEFYSIPEGRYHRIGMLQAAPQLVLFSFIFFGLFFYIFYKISLCTHIARHICR